MTLGFRSRLEILNARVEGAFDDHVRTRAEAALTRSLLLDRNFSESCGALKSILVSDMRPVGPWDFIWFAYAASPPEPSFAHFPGLIV
jgi:hypothetical protein